MLLMSCKIIFLVVNSMFQTSSSVTVIHVRMEVPATMMKMGAHALVLLATQELTVKQVCIILFESLLSIPTLY